MSESEESDADVMSMFKTEHGYTVMMYPELICRMYGGHGLRLDASGDIEVLLLTPEGSGWGRIEDLQLVQTGRTRTSIRRQ